jgi:hypothetical protein
VSEFIEAIVAAARGVVGGKLNKSEIERGRWKKLGDLLSDELKSAAEKAGPISSVPAFFEAHLRRKLTGNSANASAENLLSATNQKTVRPKNETPLHSATETPIVTAGNKSKFSIEICRRYADHLHKTNQGITNPGGYATTIQRTGEADALIEKFLIPPPKHDSTPPNACPDCKGTGYWYPQGTEKGVARCRHENLVRDANSEGKDLSRETATHPGEPDAS